MDRILFSGLVKQYINTLDNEMLKFIATNNFKVKIPSIYDFLVQNILNISQTMLITEMNFYKNNDLLVGENSKDRYNYFNNMLSDNETIESFRIKYPLVMKKNDILLDNTIIFLKEIICNTYKNENLLRSTFELKNIEIEDIDLGNGDTHNNGRTVAKINFYKKTIIYKPHSLANDIFFNNVVDFFSKSKKLKVKLKKISTISFSDYGYQEYIEVSDLNRPEDSHNYFYKIGLISGICYMLTTTDVHYENIVSHGSDPYLVDVETIFSPVVESTNSDFPKQNNSILSTCLFPFNEPAAYDNKDLSGIFGKIEFTERKMSQQLLADVFKDTIHFENTDITIEKTKFNSMSLKIEEKNPLEYIEDIKDGLIDIISELIDNKKSFLLFLSEYVTDDIVCRILKRDTQLYIEYIQASNHASYSSKHKQKEIFDILRKNTPKEDRDVVEDEISVMERNDVPYYFVKPLKRNLYSSSKKVFKNYYDFRYYDAVVTHIENITEKEMRYQLFLLDNSFAKIANPLFHNKNIELISYEENNIDFKIDFICKKIEEGISIDNREKIDFLTTKFYPEIFIGGVNYSLYEDLGTVWFLYCYSLHRKDNFRKKVALTLFSNVFETYKKIRKNSILFSEISISAFNGVGSLFYIVFNLYMTEKNDSYLDLIDMLLEDIKKKVSTTREADYLEGISGVIVLLFNAYRISKMNKMTELTISISKILDKSLINLKHTFSYVLDGYGLAHGESGLFLATIYSYVYTDDLFYKKKAESFLIEEWFLSEENKKGWCRGTSGVLSCIVESLKVLNPEDILYIKLKNLLEKELSNIISQELISFNGLGLCHGYFGYIDVILNGENFLEETLQIRVSEKINESYLYVNEQKPNINTKWNIPNFSFMLGYSGIAYQLLRQIDKRFPSVLALQFMN